MGFSGSLERLKITAYSDPDFKEKGKSLSVWMNPEKYTHGFRICYNDVQAQGSPGGSPDFNKIATDQLSFELVFDGTGVLPSPLPGVLPFTEDGVAAQVDAFKTLVFDYKGNLHSPNFLKLAWGTLLFRCRLSKMDLDFTLFKPDGTPLRARAHVTFLGYNDETALAKKAKKSSPDVSHVITVKAGDTLPLLCHRVYRDSTLYPQVARANGLSDFRQLTVGRQLVFPPLADAPAQGAAAEESSA